MAERKGVKVKSSLFPFVTSCTRVRRQPCSAVTVIPLRFSLGGMSLPSLLEILAVQPTLRPPRRLCLQRNHVEYAIRQNARAATFRQSASGNAAGMMLGGR